MAVKDMGASVLTRLKKQAKEMGIIIKLAYSFLHRKSFFVSLKCHDMRRILF